MVFESYHEAEAALAQRGFTRMVFDVGSIGSLLKLMGEPQRTFPSVHLTGTNGKTSTARMIEALLWAHGLLTGRYTSPHLHTVRERISINGRPISEETFSFALRSMAAAIAEVDASSAEPLTYFDLTTALAFCAFADARIDVGVVEVGLGGTHDSTNVLQSGVCVTTPIGLDHTEWLGNTLTDIARNKAGIIHDGAVVITAQQDSEALTQMELRCAETASELRREGEDFGVLARRPVAAGQVVDLTVAGCAYRDVQLPLHGRYQAQNAAVALAATAAVLHRYEGRDLLPEAVHQGFAAATSPGRLEKICESPTIFLDGAHNCHGASALAAALSEFSFSFLVGVVAVLRDKDAHQILKELEPVISHVIVTSNSSERSMRGEDLGAIAADVFGSGRVSVIEDIDAALEEAIELVTSAPMASSQSAGIVATGSVVTVADVRAQIDEATATRGLDRRRRESSAGIRYVQTLGDGGV